MDAQWDGALETQTLSLFGRSALLPNLPAGIELPVEASPQVIIAHELAHQWFGDSVSLERWQDLWLKEGVATYASWLWLEHSEGEEALREIVERRYTGVAQTIGGRMFSFSANPTPFDALSGPEALKVLRSLEAEALLNQQELADALPRQELTPEGETTPAAMENLTDAQIKQMIELLPEDDLTGADVLEILEVLPSSDMSGRQLFQALVVLQIYDVAGMSIFQGERIAAPGSLPADNLYNISVYDRGALALHALRLEVGDENWFALMRTYYERYQSGNAHTSDFVAVAEEVSGQKLDDFFGSWLYEEDIPSIPEMGLTMAEAIAPQADALTQAPATSQGEAATESAYKKEEITFTNGELQLAGTLVLPAGSGPHPVLVMITGSGPQDRDNSNVEMVPGYRPYQEIAARLASEGIATLRYDDRGMGESTGNVNVATPPELATDVEAALAYLLQRPEIDAEQIGLLGHSEGGLVAGIVAADNPQVAFVVLLAGQTVDMPTLQAAALRCHAAAMGQAEMGEQMAEQELEAAALAAAEDWEALEEHLYEQYTAQLENAGAGNDVDQETVAQMVQQVVNQSMAEYQSPRYLFGARYNPAEDWSEVTVPVLALYAEHDYNASRPERPSLDRGVGSSRQ